MPSGKVKRQDKAVIGARVRALTSSQNQIEVFVPTDEEVQAIREQHDRIGKLLTDRRRHEQQRRA